MGPTSYGFTKHENVDFAISVLSSWSLFSAGHDVSTILFHEIICFVCTPFLSLRARSYVVDTSLTRGGVLQYACKYLDIHVDFSTGAHFGSVILDDIAHFFFFNHTRCHLRRRIRLFRNNAPTSFFDRTRVDDGWFRQVFDDLCDLISGKSCSGLLNSHYVYVRVCVLYDIMFRVK